MQDAIVFYGDIHRSTDPALKYPGTDKPGVVRPVVLADWLVTQILERLPDLFVPDT